MALDLTGDAVPVALLADPYARQLVLAAQTGDFAMADNSMSPLDLFSSSIPKDFFGAQALITGVAVVILNGAAAPLKLIEAINPFETGRAPNQFSYPATYDFNGKPAGVHEISGTRPYLRQAKHQLPNGGPRLMGGVGIYRYGVNEDDALLDCAMRFSCSVDGKGPQIGLAFGADWGVSGGNITFYWAISADVVGKYGDLTTFYKNTSSGRICNPYDVGPVTTVWASFPSAKNAWPVHEPGLLTFTVWIRDLASTLGSA